MRALSLIATTMLVTCGTASAARALHQYTVYTQPPVQIAQENTPSLSSTYSNAVAYAQAATQVQYSTGTPTAASYQTLQPQQDSSNQGRSGDNHNSGFQTDGAGGGRSRSSGDYINDPVLQHVLDMHNRFRSKHQAGALSWSSQLQSSAQDWANRCVFQHSGPGENLAMNFPSFGSAVDAWFAEERDYRWDGQFSYSTGHFTQAIWKETTQLGCGYAASCSLYVCHYDPAGNVIGYFNENLSPATS